jgi:multicomponent Na+:H+ antiporter subunit E
VSGLLWNIALALLWTAITGSFTAWDFAVGAALGFGILSFTTRAIGAPGYQRRVLRILFLGLFFVWEFLLANARVAYDLVTPQHLMRPAVLAIDLDARTDVEITLLTIMLTLTPGSVGLDVSTDRRTLYVHLMYVDPKALERAQRQIKDGFERRLLEAMR